MKTNLSIIPDTTLSGENYGCLINGELHLAPNLFKQICDDAEIDYDVLMNLVIIDVDEIVYTERLNDLLIFAGQQVKVYKNGCYIGDGTVTCYPFEMHFEHAEVMLHSAFNKDLINCNINSLVPILRYSFC